MPKQLKSNSNILIPSGTSLSDINTNTESVNECCNTDYRLSPKASTSDCQIDDTSSISNVKSDSLAVRNTNQSNSSESGCGERRFDPESDRFDSSSHLISRDSSQPETYSTLIKNKSFESKREQSSDLTSKSLHPVRTVSSETEDMEQSTIETTGEESFTKPKPKNVAITGKTVKLKYKKTLNKTLKSKYADAETETSKTVRQGIAYKTIKKQVKSACTKFVPKFVLKKKNLLMAREKSLSGVSNRPRSKSKCIRAGKDSQMGKKSHFVGHNKNSAGTVEKSKKIKSRQTNKLKSAGIKSGGLAGTVEKSSRKTDLSTEFSYCSPSSLGNTKVTKYRSELPVPRPKMRPLPQEKLKQFSTANFLSKYRSAIKAMKNRQTKRSVFSSNANTGPVHKTILDVPKQTHHLVKAEESSKKSPSHRESRNVTSQSAVPKETEGKQSQSTTNLEQEKLTILAKEMKMDLEALKMMQKLYNYWPCFESLMNKFKTFKNSTADKTSMVQPSQTFSSETKDGDTGSNAANSTPLSVKANDTSLVILNRMSSSAAPVPSVQPPTLPTNGLNVGTTVAPVVADCPAVANVTLQTGQDEKPLSNEEMEDLNDELTDLNTSINTLKHSYGSIIRSLVNMQNRRAKKAMAMNLAPVSNVPNNNILDGSLTTGGNSNANSVSLDSIMDKIYVNYGEKYSMDRFLDSSSRDQVFNELFAEVNFVNCAMQRFRTFFDNEGYFQDKQYKESDFRISRKQHSNCSKVIKDISKVVAQVLKAYNTDLLDMFRINSNVN